MVNTSRQLTRADKFRQAALTYVGLGAIVIVLTLLAGTSAQRGRPPLLGLLIGATFIVMFGVVIYAYGWTTHRWTRQTITILSGVLVVSNALRMAQYFVNFAGYRLEINFTAWTIAVHQSAFSFPLILLLCGLLMAGITYMLARAVWDL